MQVVYDDTVADYVELDSTTVNSTNVNIRFYLNPNGATLRTGVSTEVVILQVTDGTAIGAGEKGLYVGIRANVTSGYDIRMAGRNDGGSWDLVSSYYNITDGWHLIEVYHKSATGVGANNGVATLWIDGIQQYTKTDRDTDTIIIDYIRMGTLRNMDAGDSGTIYWDDFVAQ
jgi:hypothetical protein